MTAPVRRSAARDIYGLANLLAAIPADVLEQPFPDRDTQTAIRRLFGRRLSPCRCQVDILWDEAKVDAAGLGKLDDGDFYAWPLVDMDPPRRRTDARFDTLLFELEQSVETHIRRAVQPCPDMPHSFPCTYCGGNGCRECSGSGELVWTGSAA